MTTDKLGVGGEELGSPSPPGALVICSGTWRHGTKCTEPVRGTNAAWPRLHEVPRGAKGTETGGRRLGSRGWGRGSGELLFSGDSFRKAR